MASGARRGRRDNGLTAAEYAAVADVDPRVGEHLLDVLGLAGIAAYLQPAADMHPVTRATVLPTTPVDRLFVDRSRLGTARAHLTALAPDDPPAGAGQVPGSPRSGRASGIRVPRQDGASPDNARPGDPPDTGRTPDRTAPDTGRTPDRTAPDAGRETGPDTGRTPDRTAPDTGRETEPAAPEAGTTDIGTTDVGDVEAVWAQIVAGFDADPPVDRAPWPSAEDLPAGHPGDGSTGRTPATGRTGPPPRPATGPVDPAGPPSLLDGLDTFGADLPDEDEGYRPPPPPPLPRLSGYTIAAITATVLGFAVLVFPDALPISSDTALLIGAGGLITGFVALVLRLRPGGEEDDDHGPDDGAVV